MINIVSSKNFIIELPNVKSEQRILEQGKWNAKTVMVYRELACSQTTNLFEDQLHSFGYTTSSSLVSSELSVGLA